MHNKRKKISRHDAGKTAEQMVVGNGSTDMPFPLNTTSDPEQTVVDKTSTSAIGESFERESTVSSVNGTRPNQLLPCLDNDSILDKLGEHYRDKGLGAHAGRYYLGEEIGAGGGGRVFGVIDNDLGREIAAKFASIPAKNSRVAVKHFLKEAQTMASLAHPNVVPVYDIGISSNGEPFFTMKRVRGRTLGDVIRDACMKKPVPELATHNDIVNIFLKVCDAVAYANSKGVIHQDIKHDNIMLGEFGEVLLLDWGCCSSPNADKTVSRGITGTPAFMSPEQVRREGVTV